MGGATGQTPVAKPKREDEPEGQYLQASVAELVAEFDSVADAFDRSRSIGSPRWLNGKSWTFNGGSPCVELLEPQFIPPLLDFCNVEQIETDQLDGASVEGQVEDEAAEVRDDASSSGTDYGEPRTLYGVHGIQEPYDHKQRRLAFYAADSFAVCGNRASCRCLFCALRSSRVPGLWKCCSMSLDAKVKAAQWSAEFHIGHEDDGGQCESELSEIFERVWTAAAPSELFTLSDEESEGDEKQASVPDRPSNDDDAEREVLQSLVELAVVGEAVSWPPGSSESATREAMRERHANAAPPKRARIVTAPSTICRA